MIPVPVRVVAAGVFALAGCWSLGGVALTVGLFVLAAACMVWVVAEAREPKADR